MSISQIFFSRILFSHQYFPKIDVLANLTQHPNLSGEIRSGKCFRKNFYITHFWKKAFDKNSSRTNWKWVCHLHLTNQCHSKNFWMKLLKETVIFWRKKNVSCNWTCLTKAQRNLGRSLATWLACGFLRAHTHKKKPHPPPPTLVEHQVVDLLQNRLVLWFECLQICLSFPPLPLPDTTFQNILIHLAKFGCTRCFSTANQLAEAAACISEKKNKIWLSYK